jgi:hypothetical protein
MIVDLGNLKVKIWNAFQWHDSNANCLKIRCFQKYNQVRATKMLLSFQQGSFFDLLARKVGYRTHSKLWPVIGIEHTSVIQHIPIPIPIFVLNEIY